MELIFELVSQAWELCRVPGTSFNFSHACLDSEEARQALNVLAREDPDFYAEITNSKSEWSVPGEDEQLAEDSATAWELSEGDGDDVSLTMSNVIARTASPEAIDEQNAMEETSDIASEADVSDSDEDYEPPKRRVLVAQSDPDGSGDGEPAPLRETRKRVPNKRYDEALWTRYDASDNELDV